MAGSGTCAGAVGGRIHTVFKFGGGSNSSTRQGSTRKFEAIPDEEVREGPRKCGGPKPECGVRKDERNDRERGSFRREEVAGERSRTIWAGKFRAACIDGAAPGGERGALRDG